jgi:PTH1 family peptidyl-tRNA hydrolase
MVQRWIDKLALAPPQSHKLSFSTIYSLTNSFLAVVPSTYMNLSGKAVSEAMRGGLPQDRIMIIHDDKDLPLGAGRLSMGGSSGGHNGLASIILETGSEKFMRLKLGIAPFEKPLHEWVLGEWEPDEWGKIVGMDIPFGKFLAFLAEGLPIPVIQGHVNCSSFWQHEP